MDVIISNTVALNGGDAAILFSLRKVLQEHLGDRLNLTVFDSRPDVASRLYPELDFRQLLYHRATYKGRIDNVENRYLRGGLRKTSQWLNPLRVWMALSLKRQNKSKLARRLLTDSEWRDLKTYATADLVISTGGTYLRDYYFLEPRIFDFQVAHYLDKPLVLYTQTAGPFETPRYRGDLRSALNKAELVLLRDQESIHNLEDIAVTQTPLVSAADAVFSLADPDDLEAARGRKYPIKEGEPRVAVSVRDWPYFKSRTYEEGMNKYRESVGEGVVRLVRKHGANVTFISTCQGVDEYKTDDSEVAAQIARSLPKDVRSSVTVNSSFHTPDNLKNQLETYDFTIATRMHMAILSLTAGTPVFPIAYEPKTTNLFRKMGLESLPVDIGNISSSFSDKVDHFIREICSFREKMMEGVEEERKKASDASEHIGELIDRIIKNNEN